jgi:hypothetical protein
MPDNTLFIPTLGTNHADEIESALIPHNTIQPLPEGLICPES